MRLCISGMWCITEMGSNHFGIIVCTSLPLKLYLIKGCISIRINFCACVYIFILLKVIINCAYARWALFVATLTTTVHYIYIYFYACPYTYIFQIKFWNVNCVQATAFIFDTRIGVWVFLWKCPDFWHRKYLTWGGLKPPIFGFMPNALTIWIIRARHSLTDVFNTLRLRQNGRHFVDDILKWIFLNENVWILLKISLKFVPKVQINNIPALDQIMAWRRPDDKPLSEPMMVRLSTHICITRPQWVNTGSGGIDMFEVKLPFEMLTVHGQQH